MKKLLASQHIKRPDISEVFSVDLYDVNGNITLSVDTGIANMPDLGGLVWIKSRNYDSSHQLVDTHRGDHRILTSDENYAEAFVASIEINYDGFTAYNSTNYQTSNFNVAWSFLRAKCFFDIVTYTGNSEPRNIAHALGVVPGMIIVKCRDASTSWRVYHRGLSAGQYVELNQTNSATTDSTVWNNTAPSESTFSLGTNSTVNQAGHTYVAYLFAHEDSSDGLIKCGSYQGNGSDNGPVVELGWEPQYLMVKNTTSGSWCIIDSTRAFTADRYDASIYANSYVPESRSNRAKPTPTGFQLNTNDSDFNSTGDTYLFMAIRRPSVVPEHSHEVFEILKYIADDTDSRLMEVAFQTDLVLARNTPGTSPRGFYVADRLRGDETLGTASNAASEIDGDTFMAVDSASGSNSFTSMFGFGVGNDSVRKLNHSTTQQIAYAFRRAKGFLDIACYSGTSSARNVSHNLKVPPELMIIKARGIVAPWAVFHRDLGADQVLSLDTSNAKVSNNNVWNNVLPSDNLFTVGNDTMVNGASNYVAYLFASLPGISKIGSYIGSGGSQLIDCGFYAGFILIKRVDQPGDWFIWDQAQGIIAANDPYLRANSIDAAVTTNDSVDPSMSGFIVNQNAVTNISVSDAEYIFLAIAGED